jgi:hypothetical protein
MRLSKVVDGSASSDIECAGGIRRVTVDEDGIGGRGEEDRDPTGGGLSTRGGVLLRG